MRASSVWSATLQAGTMESSFCPDNVILLGPGNSLGGPVAQVLIDQNWNDLNSKETFIKSQHTDPFLISMGMKEQRYMVL